MAKVGTVQRAPEIVFANDGVPVENVGSSTTGRKIAMIAIPGVLALVIGIAVGRGSRGANDYNDGVNASAQLIEIEKPLKATVSKIKDLIPTQATKQGEKPALHPDIKPDAKRDAQLKALAAQLDVKAATYTLARNVTADGDVAHDMLSFLAGVEELHAMMNQHTLAATFDDQGAAAAAGAGSGSGSGSADAAPTRYGIISTVEDNGTGVRFVELGPPYCNGKLATGGSCQQGESVSGIAWRAEPSAAWQPGDIAANGEPIASKKVVPFTPTSVLDAMLKTSPVGASEIIYARRLQSIFDRADALVELGNKVEGNLQKVVAGGTKFSFFM